MVPDLDNLQFRTRTICVKVLVHLTPVVPEILVFEKRYGRTGSVCQPNVLLCLLRSERSGESSIYKHSRRFV